MAASAHPHVYMEELEEPEDEDSEPHQMWNPKMAGMETRLDERLLACLQHVGHKSSDEQQQPISCRLPLLDGLLRIGIVNEEPPYAEPHVRWCERTKSEPPLRKTHFSPTRLYKQRLERPWHPISSSFSLKIRPLFKSEHLGNQAARKFADALVIGLGGFVEAFALSQDAVLATG